MSLIASVRDYIKEYSELVDNAPVWVNFLGVSPTEYSIVALPGAGTVETYLDGSTLESFPFAFQSVESTADNAERLANLGFFQAFKEWLSSQTENELFPTLDAGKTPEKIEAVDGGVLLEQGESGTGIYSVTCQLLYGQVAPS